MTTRRRATRRDFLKGAAAVAIGAPLVIPASALGREGWIAPSDRIGVGVIGFGLQGPVTAGLFQDPYSLHLPCGCQCSR